MVLKVIIYGMIVLGSLLMAWNIFSYIRYVRSIQGRSGWGRERQVLHIPIFLLVLFLIGYVCVGAFGSPDFIIAGILFGGSIFVFLIFWVLERITKKIQSSERLEAKLMASEAANRTKTEFLSSVSHEMRTPMNAILGLDAMALKDASLSGETRRQLEQLGASARHLLGLINNMLDINDIESGRLQLKEAPFSLRDLVAQSNTMISLPCADKWLHYEGVVLGEPDERYLGDDYMLERMLLLVLDNAVKFTNHGGTVRFTAEQIAAEGETRTLRFVVSDTGVGIDSAALPHIFDVFAREAGSATSRYSGAGLGLPLARTLAELMGGTITAESEKGRGSRFTITVQVRRCDAPEPAAVSDDTEPEGFGLEGRRILVVEDIEINAEIIMDLLEMEGALSEHAENGQIAVDMFSSHELGYYDAILMDLRMPVMDGITAAHTIRALARPDAKTVPILALTANNQEEDKKQTKAAGMDAHLAKPVDSDALFAELSAAIRRREKR